MAKKKTNNAALVQEVAKLGEAYPSITPRMPKDLDQKSFDAMGTRFLSAMTGVQRLETALKQARAVRTDAAKATRKFLKRVRRSVEGSFGDDSAEFASVGGKRISERKKPVRHPKQAPPAQAPAVKQAA